MRFLFLNADCHWLAPTICGNLINRLIAKLNLGARLGQVSRSEHSETSLVSTIVLIQVLEPVRGGHSSSIMVALSRRFVRTVNSLGRSPAHERDNVHRFLIQTFNLAEMEDLKRPSNISLHDLENALSRMVAAMFWTRKSETEY
jgi:hypothetical protein